MEKPVKERRRMSQMSLLDSAIRTLSQLASSRDSLTRSLASRVLADLQTLRLQIPIRRQHDGKSDVK
jgi:hypothetical protein